MQNIFQWNILSQDLINPKFFPSEHYPAEVLDSKKRFELTLKILQDPVDKNAIISLQEVSTSWQGPITDFFHNSGYKIITAAYGDMAVCLAYPAKFKARDTSIVWMNSLFDRPKRTYMSYLQGIIGFFVKQKFDSAKYCSSRNNKIIITTLSDGENEIKVATVHMPCIFTEPQTTDLISKKVSDYISKVVENDPAIVMGDFNFTPESDASISFQKNFKLAEPTGATCKTHKFEGCIDFVFYRNLQVQLERNHLTKIIPSTSNPSDHLPVRGSFN